MLNSPIIYSQSNTSNTHRPPMKKPPKDPIKSLQLDLFSHFVTNDLSQVSNTVELWERIPKYFFTTKQAEKLRTIDGLAKPYKWTYKENGNEYSVSIQPALIEQKNRGYKAYFPGVTEELIEEALKKIFSDQQYAIHDPEKIESWVKFTLGMLQKELKIRGRTRDLDQIKHAIEVMSKCNITLSKNNKEIWNGNILQDIVTVGRKEYLASTDTHHIARLPLFISHSINNLDYRQFNYDRLMSCNEQLTRWIYKRLINRFTQASPITEYSCMYSDIKQTSGLLQQTREIDNRRKILSAFNELQQKGIIQCLQIDERKTGRTISDVKYTIKAAPQFISEQIASNKRATDTKTIAQKSNIRIIKKA